jgi:AraC-like DNA-binding protein
LLELMATHSGDRCFGLRFARTYPTFGTKTLGYIALNAPDLATMIQCVMRYARLSIDTLEFALEERRGKVRFSWRFHLEPPFAHKQLVEFLSCLFVLRVNQLTGRALAFEAASFVYAAPPCLEDYRELFGANLTFGAPTNSLVFSAENLPSPAIARDQRLYDMLRGIADQELLRHALHGGIATDLSSFIIAHLAVEGVTLEHFALTPRQLQGDLRRLGTTFEKEIMRVRTQLAERYLRDTELSLTEIAMLLGFSQLSAFTRAARRWFGVPPSEARGALRAAAKAGNAPNA